LPLCKDEKKLGKRSLSEFLSQGDFYGGYGNLGFHYQDKKILSEMEFDLLEDFKGRQSQITQLSGEE
jgi:hypothetical protein